MSSGRRERVVISCVTFETVKISDPVIYYDATRAHLIHYIRGDLDPSKKNVYKEFYDKVCSDIRKKGRDVEIIEHLESVSNFSKMLKIILKIIDDERKRGECDIYVNISAGSSEYAAAATIASMMSKDVMPFSVGSNSFTISSDEEIRRFYYKDNQPVGLTSSTREPKILPIYEIQRPPEHLVKGLRVLKERIDGHESTSSSEMGPLLIEKGLWIRDMEKKSHKKKDEEKSRNQSFAVNYHRDFMQKWMELGWVVKDKVRKRDIITEKGINVLNTFYVTD